MASYKKTCIRFDSILEPSSAGEIAIYIQRQQRRDRDSGTVNKQKMMTNNCAIIYCTVLHIVVLNCTC